MTAPIIRAAAYIRVSTEEQTEFSPDAQLRAVNAYCHVRDITLSAEHVYRDDGLSAKRAETRPAFMRMISDAKLRPKPFDIILVHKFDRFARNREDSVVYKSMLRKQCGVKVVSVTEQLEDDKFSIILESILEAMAEYYSLNLSDEVLKGMTEKALRGELQTPAPLGYVMMNGTLMPSEEEASVVREIFELYTCKNMSSAKIAEHLNHKLCFTKKGNQFKKRSVDYILQNPVYSGKTRWKPRRKTVGENSDTEAAIITNGSHMPIVDEQTYQLAAEKQAAEKASKAKIKRSFASHSLSGILKCKRCGGKMYLCGNIFRCGNYLNKKCPYPQGITASGIERLIAAKSAISENGESPDRRICSVHFDKETSSVDISYE